MAAPTTQMPGAWTTDIFDCFDDPWTCFITAICPGRTFGKVANIIDKGMTSRCHAACTYFFLLHCNCFTMGLTPWMYTRTYRKKLRKAYNLPEEPCCDCAVQYFLESFSLCQMYRELQNRGFDMSKDYQQNMEQFARNGVPLQMMAHPSMQPPPMMAPHNMQPPPMMAPPNMQPPPMQFIHPQYAPYQQQAEQPKGEVIQPEPITEAKQPALLGTPSF